MKIKGLAIVLAVILSFPMESIAVNASGVELEKDAESSVIESEESDILTETEETILEEVLERESEKAPGFDVDVSQLAENLVSIDENEYINQKSDDEEIIKETETVEATLVTDDMIQFLEEFEVSDGILIKYNGTAENVVIPGNLGITSIGNEAFYENNNIKTVRIPEGVVSIEDGFWSGLWYVGAFSACRNLKNVVLPTSLLSIGSASFNDCSNLSSINIPSNVTYIGRKAFEYCKSLTYFRFPSKIKVINNSVLSGCENLRDIIIPSGVISIGDHAFSGCSNLMSITLPNGITEIGTWAFSSCNSLTSITIPESVTEIRNASFAFCNNLKAILFLGNAPTIKKEYHPNEVVFFAGCPEDLLIIYINGKTGFGRKFQGRTVSAMWDNNKFNFVTRLYEKVLNRKPDISGLDFHITALTNGNTTGAVVAHGFIFSSEVTNRNLSNSAFIEMLYEAFMGRRADTSGLSYWKNMLENGVSREYVFRGFVESNEFMNICITHNIPRGNITPREPRDQNANLTMFVFRCYQKALGRIAEVDGLNYYTQEILLKRVTPVQAAQNFIFSPEFKNKNLSNSDYVKVLYRTFMGREFDQSGLNYHLNRINNGTSREEILLGFAYSPEFKGIMNGFGL